MIKYISIISLIFLSELCYSQEKDTADISFKAKLLTVDRHGILDENKLVEEIEKQKLEFIEYNDSSNWVFMKIKFDQKYGNYKNDHSTLWLGDCNFYIAFNKETSKFYRLGGFDILDVDDFIDDMHEDLYFDIHFDENLNEEIPIHCIESYVKLSEKMRLKKGHQCFSPCSKKLTTNLIVN